MQDNYNSTNDERDIFAEAFQRDNDPAEVASSAARREYSNIIAQSKAQERSTSEAYSDMYAKMKQAAFRRRQATPSRGFTGGMENQRAQSLSAAEMQQLGGLGRAEEQAQREIQASRQSAFSNALIAGQQQADYASMLQNAEFAKQQQAEEILNNRSYSEDAQRRLLRTLGYSEAQIDEFIDGSNASTISRAAGGLSTVSGNIANYGDMPRDKIGG